MIDLIPRQNFMRILLLKGSKDVDAIIRSGVPFRPRPKALDLDMDLDHCIGRYVHTHFNLMVYGAGILPVIYEEFVVSKYKHSDYLLTLNSI